ncbi:MAG: hypothetical protein JWM46_114 [Candidatus Kaiserbacteria bacterium]|nr:hypothetical protein [Candidatus Kaiserbacteria bacterium]
MGDQNYTASFTTKKTPEEVFKAITNVRSWWSGEIVGDTETLGDEFVYSYKDIHRSKQKITELVPGKKVVWHVLEAHLSFVKDSAEWVGTDIVFEISIQDGKTYLTFTHIGLTPAFACYGACSNGWEAFIIGNLQNFISTGKVPPNPFEK